MEHQKKPNKISEIVRLQRILKKWKKLANAPKPTHSHTNSGTTTTISKSSSSSNLNTGTSKSIKFLKKTLSLSDRDHGSSSFTSFNANNDVVPKGYLAVCVGKELKRFIIPTEYLGHQAFGILLREAEEEFGFQQEGVLKIPCDVPLFEKIVKMVQEKREVFFLQDPSNCFVNDGLMNTSSIGCYSPDQSSCELAPTSDHAQLCR